MDMDIHGRLAAIKTSLAGSKVKLPLELKLRVAELVLRLTARDKSFGLFIIVGWRRKWQSYLDFSDIRQDLFLERRINVLGTKEELSAGYRNLGQTVDFDGAILIDAEGNLVHSGAFIEGLRPRLVANRLNRGAGFRDLSEQFGFKCKVHARHLSAITASYVFKGTTVFTVSEENDDVHVFEGGRIIFTMRS